ncbi:metal ABC transporter permease [Corynebacterium cystitidis]|uniref:Manganese/zinc/iron transport system permease protein n=1 Tax=Corynebacterium cystitidis DSM 20524 TaxID=1121357 RepID=A0A1H9QWG9_9CORY|nr:metal ABC transporter permease [Corynebacterium cystitidis]WJY81640.1 Manganese transport system membrane protein MntB [Corynebacterium cystitidis DSM 20524]SER64585.1 manganese/zinc/iron transport system permease protein [Corynebacterium cystitidis DSM 20524]SNV85408.1 ABC transporter [Corynebacterium cystitidis]
MSLSEFFTNYTYTMVFVGTTAIGLVAGALGVFAYLRKQSLIADVISHSALPGTLLAFLFMSAIGLQGRTMGGLIIGAVVVGVLATAAVNWIERNSIIALDTSMAVVLTGFFGAGMLLMQYIDRRPIPGKAGVQDYLFGNASTLTRNDITVSLVVGALALAIMLLFWKEFTAASFDPEQSQLQGFSRSVVDTLMFTTLVIATVIGLKAVGLVLMVAFVITPAAAARQFSRSVRTMVLLAALIGASASAAGSYLSISFGPLPTGPVIAVVLAVILLLAIVFSPRKKARS